MFELDPPRMERDAAAGQRTPRAVFQVAADRTPDLRQLGADLVVTPREQFDLDQRSRTPSAASARVSVADFPMTASLTICTTLLSVVSFSQPT